MKDLMKELDSAFRMLSSIPVSGEAVDLMAGARNKLRNIYSELKKMDSEHADEQTDV